MEILDLDVLPLKGLGALNFGMSMEGVTKILGEPDEVEDLADNDNFNTTVLSYNETGISAFFEGIDAPILSCIEIDHRATLLFGKKAFEMSREDLIQHMNQNGFEDLDKEEEEWGESRISFEDGLIDFYYNGQELTTINFGVLVNEKGEIETL